MPPIYHNSCRAISGLRSLRSTVPFPLDLMIPAHHQFTLKDTFNGRHRLIMKKIWIEYLRFIALIAVITTHSTTRIYMDFGNIQLFDWWMANILNAASRFSVPLFVMISGCVLLGRNIGIKDFYIKRGARLLPAFLIWSFFYVVFFCVSNGKDLNIIYMLKRFVIGLSSSGKTYYHLWYLSMFICLMFFAPFINNYILGKKPNAEDFFYFLISISVFMLLNQISGIGQAVFGKNIHWYKLFFWYIGYFIMGYVIDVYNDKIPLNSRISIIFILCILSFGCISNYYLAENLNIVIGWLTLKNEGILNFLLTLNIFYLFSKNRKKFSYNSFVFKASSMSFGIYLIHPVFLHIFRTHILSGIENSTLTIFLLVILTFFFSFLAISILIQFKWLRSICQ